MLLAMKLAEIKPTVSTITEHFRGIQRIQKFAFDYLTHTSLNHVLTGQKTDRGISVMLQWKRT